MKFRFSIDKIQLFSYFALIAFLGSFLLMMPAVYVSGESVSYIDALFTSVSAVCVTGLSTLSMDVYSTTGFIIIAILIQFGGLGLITFISFYIAGPKRKLSLVSSRMVKDFFISDVEYDPKKILKSILLFTFFIEFIAGSFLTFFFYNAGSKRPFLDGFFHSISAFCNAGFSTYSQSMEAFSNNYPIVITLLLLIVFGGIGFIVISDIGQVLRRKKRGLSFHSKLTLGVSALFILLGTCVFFIVEASGVFDGLSLGDTLLYSFFQSITPRTAGFSTVPQSLLSPASKMATICLMFIGGSPGSIAGGVKTTTFLIVLLYALRGNPEHQGFVFLRRHIDSQTIEKAFNVVGKSLLFIISSIFLLLLTEQQNIIKGVFGISDIFFESISAFSTVGLSLGVTDKLTEAGRIVLILTMYIGRTGIVAMALGFVQKENTTLYTYPSGKVMIG